MLSSLKCYICMQGKHLYIISGKETMVTERLQRRKNNTFPDSGPWNVLHVILTREGSLLPTNCRGIQSTVGVGTSVTNSL